MAKAATGTDPEALEEMNAGVAETLRRIHSMVSSAGFEIQGARVVDPANGLKPVSATISGIDLMRLQFPDLGEESYRRLSGFVHGAAWALGKATMRFAAHLHSPTIDAMTVIWAFDLCGRSLGKMMAFSASYAGIPLGNVPERLDALSRLPAVSMIACASERAGRSLWAQGVDGTLPSHPSLFRPVDTHR
ncbi:hypothetical protein [Arthrobacter sp. MI7-26]|uniref:hypothetical protein n=1 Tax=Arthrobacter sp. MI7-26 TaxID=2993653 RepID=UPI002248F016|nr:hypothetical protein [Arthrobacter sp. MI7-26]